ncbi:hypothetical protein [uncultured Pseudoteredinibacter sp.]|uniref:COG4648 family protein n=1 Tax=uncultured Pseudoteredinibacter sp. TaxID=1641701 RepID=UPI002613B646|nr:hypothetical protein [uncultured Pseudoteredinibacter sp.]
MRSLILLVLLIAILHSFNFYRGDKKSLIWILACLAIAAFSWLSGSDIWLKFYPVIINLGMLSLFSWSLLNPPPIIERLARLTEPELPEHAVRYTRAVTIVWVAFFAFNSVIAGALALFASDELWALYNGGIAYLIIGLIFAVERLYRNYYRSKHER